jgi:cobalt-zinc-cadmium efflux system membrane fusion protein
MAELGQKVKKGAPLAMISSPDVGGFVADVAKAQAALTAADHEYKRQQDLYGYAAPVRAGTLRDLEAARDSWRKAQAEVERAKQKLQLLGDANVDQVTQAYVLRSPIAGEVIARNATPGLEIQGQYALQGNVVELFTIGSTDKLWVLGDVPEMDRPKVEEGGEVAITVGAYPDKVFQGTVEWVADVLDPVLHTAKVRCSVDNAEHLLRPDMYEAVKISLPPRRVLVLPRAALMRTGNETVVFVATGRHRPDGGVVFQRRKVIANESVAGDLLPVSSGLRPGESVAVEHAVLLLGML